MGRAGISERPCLESGLRQPHLVFHRMDGIAPCCPVPVLSRSAKGETHMKEKPSVTLAGTVERVIESPHPNVPEKVQIAVEEADDLYREIRIENTLTKKNGEKVSIKKGAHVEVTVEVPPEATTPKK